MSYSGNYPNKGKSTCAQIAPNMTVAGDSDDQLQVSNQSSSASENEDVTKPGTAGSVTTKRSSLTQALNEMTEQTQRLSASSSGNEEVDYVGNVDVKVNDVKVIMMLSLTRVKHFNINLRSRR